MKLSPQSQLVLVAGFPLVVASLLFLSPLVGQETKGKEKAKGRLPAYYSQVVDEKQRAKIYEIQAKYKKDTEPIQEQIDKLEADLKKITDKQKAEIEAVLSKEQKEKLDKLVADAKAKGKKSAETSKDEEKKPE